MSVVAGFDIGGAHLKVARVEHGRVVSVEVVAMPLWRGLDQLDAALGKTREIWSSADKHVVTMTAELTEIFDSRAAGVESIVERITPVLSLDMKVYLGLKGFGSASDATRDPSSVASANFLATASLIARLSPKSLLIDMGSTTTDIVTCDRPHGLTDAERLQTGELVYTGYTRTPVPSVTTTAPLLGQWQSLARDTFATMADVRRVLGEIGVEHVDLHETADGRGKSIEESLARLSRGFGRDGEMRHLKVWQIAAAHIREAQVRSIHDGAVQVLSRPATDVTQLVTAGIGAACAGSVGNRLGLEATMFGTLVAAGTGCEIAATHHAAAVAVALLASD